MSMSPKKVGSLLAMRSPVGDFFIMVESDEKRIDTRIPAKGKGTRVRGECKENEKHSRARFRFPATCEESDIVGGFEGG